MMELEKKNRIMDLVLEKHLKMLNLKEFKKNQLILQKMKIFQMFKNKENNLQPEEKMKLIQNNKTDKN